MQSSGAGRRTPVTSTRGCMNRDGLEPEYWRKKPLDGLSRHEWEALCDGCGKCCLLKLEDEDTGALAYTRISCRLLDTETCRCGNYALRKQLVKDCVIVRPETLDSIAHWMPGTCAYKLLWQGEDLPDWHPLVTGDPDSTHKLGMSLAGQLVPEYEVEEDDYQDYTVGGVL